MNQRNFLYVKGSWNRGACNPTTTVLLLLPTHPVNDRRNMILVRHPCPQRIRKFLMFGFLLLTLTVNYSYHQHHYSSLSKFDFHLALRRQRIFAPSFWRLSLPRRRQHHTPKDETQQQKKTREQPHKTLVPRSHILDLTTFSTPAVSSEVNISFVLLQ